MDPPIGNMLQLKKIKFGISKIKINKTKNIVTEKKRKSPVSKVLAEGQKDVLRI